jgi:hypothetical protein
MNLKIYLATILFAGWILSGDWIAAKFTIKREDFKVGKPGGSVGNLITIELNIPVNK